MALTQIRILKTFAAATVVGVGATIIYAAISGVQTSLTPLAFGLGVSIILAAIPIMPWLIVKPTLFDRRYWGRVVGREPRGDDDVTPG